MSKKKVNYLKKYVEAHQSPKHVIVTEDKRDNKILQLCHEERRRYYPNGRFSTTTYDHITNVMGYELDDSIEIEPCRSTESYNGFNYVYHYVVEAYDGADSIIKEAEWIGAKGAKTLHTIRIYNGTYGYNNMTNRFTSYEKLVYLVTVEEDSYDGHISVCLYDVYIKHGRYKPNFKTLRWIKRDDG